MSWRATDRPLTDRERALLRRALESMREGKHFGGGEWIDLDSGQVKDLNLPEDPSAYLAQVEGLRVVQECPCGTQKCESVRFAEGDATASRGAIAVISADGQNVIVHIDTGTRQIVKLEIV